VAAAASGPPEQGDTVTDAADLTTHAAVASYYDLAIAAYDATTRAVDWENTASHNLVGDERAWAVHRQPVSAATKSAS
jgi:hypothetical protein